MGASEYRLLSLRLPSELVRRADAIAETLRERGEYDVETGGDMSRSTIMRRAIALGLRELADALPRGTIPGVRQDDVDTIST